jgi:hypothetical protein
MKVIRFSDRTLSSEFLQKSDYKNCVFLNERYDPAILGVDNVTGSIIYSLSLLIQIEMWLLEGDDLLEGLVSKGDLHRFLSGSFLDLFSDLHDTADGVAPTILYDIVCDYKLRA